MTKLFIAVSHKDVNAAVPTDEAGQNDKGITIAELYGVVKKRQLRSNNDLGKRSAFNLDPFHRRKGFELYCVGSTPAGLRFFGLHSTRNRR